MSKRLFIILSLATSLLTTILFALLSSVYNELTKFVENNGGLQSQYTMLGSILIYFILLLTFAQLVNIYITLKNNKDKVTSILINLVILGASLVICVGVFMVATFSLYTNYITSPFGY